MTGWRQDAACKGSTDPRIFGTRDQQREYAAEVCSGCPVRASCAEQGANEPAGVWGGTVEGTKHRPKRSASWATPKPPAFTASVRERDSGITEDSPEARHVLIEVAHRYGVALSELVGKGRGLAAARVDAMVALRGLGLSYPAIGRAVGRDQSTVQYHVKKVAA